MHPGPELETIEKGICPWNTSEHKRKFMRSEGEYIPAKGQPLLKGEIVFWGEWEPPSIVQKFRGNDDWPRNLHIPVLCKPPRRALNTDPYVFGKSFFIQTVDKQSLNS